MSKFKKQAIKLKKDLNEKGFKIPLVSIQESLAKSYGFNNRHVVLKKEKEFDDVLSKLHTIDSEKEFITDLKNMPSLINKNNIDSLSFYFQDQYNMDDGFVGHISEIELLGEESLEDGTKIFIFEEKIKNVKIKDLYTPENIGISHFYDDYEYLEQLEDFFAKMLFSSLLDSKEFEYDRNKIKHNNFLMKMNKEMKNKLRTFISEFISNTEYGEIEIEELSYFVKTDVSYTYDKNNNIFIKNS